MHYLFHNAVKSRQLIRAPRLANTTSPLAETRPVITWGPAHHLPAPLSITQAYSSFLRRSSNAHLDSTPRFSNRNTSFFLRSTLLPSRHCSCRTSMHSKDAEDITAMDVTKGREVLPKNVKPTHYNVELEPDLEKYTYEGSVDIDLDVLENTNYVSLNTLQLDVKHVEVHGQGGFSTSSPSISHNEDSQTTTFSLEKSLQAGSQAKLHIQFSGSLNDHLAGFYRSSYHDKGGNKKYMATTQMEATDARRAIPCFDEPALKAKFTVTLIADKHLTCLSNMDVKSEKRIISKVSGGEKKAITFNTTPLMSTYLLAFIVGELNYVGSNQFRVPVRVYAPPDQDIELGRFSVDLAAKTLAFYEEKFDSKFPLPKMDMVAIPDFSAGAMENWGLVTYRIVDILFDEKKSGANQKLRVAEVVQHELAHQWFGNLVTMDFWDGLWLNEGFATWMSWYACDSFFPEWKVWENYVTDSLASALSLDSLRSSHPIEVPVKRADEINQIFDAISYEKGSCVLRMIAKYLGEETFLGGIRRYIKKHAYGNTQTTDLWNALSAESDQEVAKVMEIWTKHVGYPVVKVTEDRKSGTVHLEQNRFLRTGDVQPDEDKISYPVFLGLRTSQGVDESATLFDRSGDFKLPTDDFFKLNANQSGVFRTFYSQERLEKLGRAAKDGRLSTEDRAGMIADAGALAASGYQPTTGTLTLLQGFSNEPEYVVWDQIVTSIGSIRSAWVFEPDATKDALKAFLRNIAGPKAHSLGWEFKEGEDSIQQQFKTLMFAAVGSSGDKTIISSAFEMFEKFSKGEHEAINPNIRGSVYGMVLQDGGEKEYEIVYHQFKNAETADERNTALRALGRSKKPDLIQRTLQLALNGEVRNQDIYMPLSGLRAHKEGTNALWEFVKSNWDRLVEKLPPGLMLLGSVVSMSTSSFTHEEQKKDVEEFFRNKSTKGFDQTLAQSLDGVTAKIKWLGRDRSSVDAWLKENKYH